MHNDRVNSCPELDYPHTSLWCGGCTSRQQTSRIASALEGLVNILSKEEGRLEMNIRKEQKKYIPPKPREDKQTFKGIDV